jgi:hypothetical protein
MDLLDLRALRDGPQAGLLHEVLPFSFLFSHSTDPPCLHLGGLC